MTSTAARFDRVEQRLDRLETGQTDLKTDVAQLKADVDHLKTDVIDLKQGMAQLRNEMHVLHEDAIDRIRAIPTDVPTRAEWRQAFAEQNEWIGQRLDPLEAAVRELIRLR